MHSGNTPGSLKIGVQRFRGLWASVPGMPYAPSKLHSPDYWLIKK